MTKTNRSKRTCSEGHPFYKSSDCPTCPVCEAQRKPKNGFLAELAAPARRALEGVGLTTPAKLSRYSEQEILRLHGLGPSTLPKLKKALKNAGLSFSKT